MMNDGWINGWWINIMLIHSGVKGPEFCKSKMTLFFCFTVCDRLNSCHKIWYKKSLQISQFL